MEIEIEETVRRAAPRLKVLQIEADIVNGPTPDPLWAELRAECAAVKERYALAQVNKRPAIAATRAAYKALGKDPNRYRPSAEALCRRCVRGLDLYRIDAAVDIINLVSMRTGHSIGGFDMDKIRGGVLRLGRGEEGEPFEGIGRGPLNICGLPVYRDAAGGIGTPTSDHERTKLGLSTRRLLMCVNMYEPEADPAALADGIAALLRRYLAATSVTSRLL